MGAASRFWSCSSHGLERRAPPFPLSESSQQNDLRFPDLLLFAAVLAPVVAVYNALGLSHIFALVAVAAIVVAVRSGLSFAMPNRNIVVLLVVLVVWAGLTTIWAIDPGRSLNRLGKLSAIVVAGCCVVGATMTISQVQQRRLAMVLAVAWLVAAALLVLEAYFDGSIFLDKVFGPWLHNERALAALKRGGAVLLILSWIVAPALYRMRLGIVAAVVLLAPGFFLVKIGANAATIAWGVGLFAAIVSWLLPRKILAVSACAVPVLLVALPLAVARIPTDLSNLTGALSSSAGNTLRKINVPKFLLPADVDESVQLTLEGNPALRAAMIGTQAAGENINVTRSTGFYPTLQAIGEMKFKKDVAGTFGYENEQLGKVQLTWPFNLGLTAINTLRASELQYTANLESVADLRDQLEEQARNAWANYTTALENAKLLRNQANIAGEFLELARKERQLGKRSLIDVLAGETALINSNSDAISAETDVSVAGFTLLQVMGQLGLEVIVGGPVTR